MYSDRGVKDDRPARSFLLAPSFTHAFLRRLSLVSVEVTPCLARDVNDGNGARLTIIEPAAPIFGLEAVERRASTDAERDGRQPFWPDGVLPSEEAAAYGNRSAAREAAPSSDAVSPTDEPVPLEDMPGPDAPEERFPWELDAEVPGALPEEVEAADDTQGLIRRPAATPLPDEPSPPGTFETLTVEELDEFERFERQRRERGRRSS